MCSVMCIVNTKYEKFARGSKKCNVHTQHMNRKIECKISYIAHFIVMHLTFIVYICTYSYTENVNSFIVQQKPLNLNS